MQRALTAVVGLAAVGLAVWVVVRSVQAPKPTTLAATARSSSTAAVEEKEAVMSALGDASLSQRDRGGLLRGELAQSDLRQAGQGPVLGEGAPVPPLPFSAPQQVRFGIVVISFSGAQPNPGEGPPTRSVADAKALADKLLAAATRDFHAAVQEGDPGSADDIGRVRLGVLEPAPEYVLFTLPVGGVGGPVETPRGFWIVKRLE